MATTDIPTTTEWTAGDLLDRFGNIPLWRIVFDPPPGTATPEDVTRLDDHRDFLCELVDGTLVRKAVGFKESLLAAELISLLNLAIKPANLGVVLGEAGTIRMADGSVRIPDVSFASWQSLEGSDFQTTPIPRVTPDLAVEIISKSNTRKELERKLNEYFADGVKLVWYIDPRSETIRAYSSPQSFRELAKGDTLDAGEIIPGFQLDVAEFFRIEPPQS